VCAKASEKLVLEVAGHEVAIEVAPAPPAHGQSACLDEENWQDTEVFGIV